MIADVTSATFCASGIPGRLSAAAARLTEAGQPLTVATDVHAVRRPLTLLGLDRYLTVVATVAGVL